MRRFGFLNLSLWAAVAALSPAWAGTGGGMDTGGGDPLEIAAEAYPDAAGLQAAMELAQQRIQASTYPEKFKADMTAEIAALARAGKYKYLPALILIGNPSGGMEGYPIPTDLDRFISLGGMTRLYRGATVFFSERVTHYPAERFAELLIHEVAHHEIDRFLSEDEGFVSDLARSLMSGQSTSALQVAVKFGLYLRPTRIEKMQFVDALEASGAIDGFKDWWDGDRSHDLQLALISQMGRGNIAELPVEHALFYLSGAIGYAKFRTPRSQPSHAAPSTAYLLEARRILAKYSSAINPDNPYLLQGDVRTCKVKPRFIWYNCPDSEVMRLKDLFTVPSEKTLAEGN